MDWMGMGTPMNDEVVLVDVFVQHQMKFAND